MSHFRSTAFTEWWRMREGRGTQVAPTASPKGRLEMLKALHSKIFTQISKSFSLQEPAGVSCC